LVGVIDGWAVASGGEEATSVTAGDETTALIGVVACGETDTRLRIGSAGSACGRRLCKAMGSESGGPESGGGGEDPNEEETRTCALAICLLWYVSDRVMGYGRLLELWPAELSSKIDKRRRKIRPARRRAGS